MKLKTNNFSITNISQLFLLTFLYIFTTQSKGQVVEVKKIDQEKFKKFSVNQDLKIDNYQESKFSKSTIYFVNNKVISNDSLKAIPKNEILSIDIIERDTVIDSIKFETQILVKLKNSTSK